MPTKLLHRLVLQRLVPAPLRPPIRRVALFLIPPVRRRLTRSWRRRNRLRRRLWGTRGPLSRLRRKPQKALKNVWRRQVKQRIWLPVRLRLWYWRRGKRSVENSNEIHLISPLRHATGGVILRTLNL